MSHDNALPPPVWPDDDAAPAGLHEPAPSLARLSALLVPWRYDRQLVAGATPTPGSPLAVHVERLTSDSERQKLTTTLRELLHEAHDAPAPFSSRIQVNQAAVASAAGHIDDIAARLCGPRPVRAHGVARLRMLLSNGVGPVYEEGRGDLAAALRGVLAEL